MPRASNVLFRTITRIRRSIAFYPALIAFLYMLLVALVYLIEGTELARELRANLPAGMTDPSNAREILGTLITGIISLAVFSFSMVMVVLNGAATRLSPRVLPGLISDTRNRVILGVYLGSVLFFLLQIGLLHRVDTDSEPSLGIVIALMTGVLCMVLFVLFIHSVSQSIQVEWVVNQLYKAAAHELHKRRELLASTGAAFPDDHDWPVLRMPARGYLRSVNEQALGELLCRRKLVMTVQVEPGFFLVEGHPLLRISDRLSEEDERWVLDCFDFSEQEFASANAAYGLRQMSEIAVKAISPAVNDPGTAMRTINLIGVLLGGLMGLPAHNVGCFDGGRPRLFYRELAMPRLLFAVVSPIRTYGSSDPQILLALLRALRNALRCSEPLPEQLRAVWDEVMAIREAGDARLVNTLDRRTVNQEFERLNRLETGLPDVAPLAVAEDAWQPLE